MAAFFIGLTLISPLLRLHHEIEHYPSTLSRDRAPFSGHQHGAGVWKLEITHVERNIMPEIQLPGPYEQAFQIAEAIAKQRLIANFWKMKAKPELRRELRAPREDTGCHLIDCIVHIGTLASVCVVLKYPSFSRSKGRHPYCFAIGLELHASQFTENEFHWALVPAIKKLGLDELLQLDIIKQIPRPRKKKPHD